MTIFVVLVGLLISHYATGVRRLRRFDWLLQPVRLVARSRPEPAWLTMLVVILIAWLAALLAEALMTGLLGHFGWLLLALVVFIYCLGPRDLDKDVALLTERASETADPAVAEALAGMQLAPGDPPQAAGAAVYHAALSRWFGLLFWFVLLGIPGALLYRLARFALQDDHAPPVHDWLVRLRLVLDWPVLFLMVLSAGLCSDLDRVLQVWRERARETVLWGLTPAILDRIAQVHVAPDADFAGALQAAHEQVWRMLILWLVVLSLFLIAGWLV